MISAKIIADSRNEFGNRITSFVCVFPRIILAEINTHRMLSRNSASSRAIPFEKMLERVQSDPFIPIKWMIDHSGMQGNQYFTDQDHINECTAQWLNARDNAIASAEAMSNIDVISDGIDSGDRPSKETPVGVTKQIVNRLLEPFMYHTAIITATEWENFFALRAHEAAEIHLQDLAYKMLEAMNASTPRKLKGGEWHIPFGDQMNADKLTDLQQKTHGTENSLTSLMLKIATARCARVSYMNFEGKDDYEADIKLFQRLADSGHFSPFEHCAKAMTEAEYSVHQIGSQGFSGNFKGFIQLRKTLAYENKTDSRLKK